MRRSGRIRAITPRATSALTGIGAARMPAGNKESGSAAAAVMGLSALKSSMNLATLLEIGRGILFIGQSTGLSN